MSEYFETAASDRQQGIKPGDRVRVTVEMEVKWVSHGGTHLDGVTDGDGVLSIAHDVSPDCKIERIEPPLKVGDRVRPKQGREEYFVLAIAGENVWCGEALQPDLGQCWSSALSDLELIA